MPTGRTPSSVNPAGTVIAGSPAAAASVVYNHVQVPPGLARVGVRDRRPLDGRAQPSHLALGLLDDRRDRVVRGFDRLEEQADPCPVEGVLPEGVTVAPVGRPRTPTATPRGRPVGGIVPDDVVDRRVLESGRWVRAGHGRSGSRAGGKKRAGPWCAGAADRRRRQAREVEEAVVGAAIRFGIPESTDAVGSCIWAEDGVIQEATRGVVAETDVI